MHTTDVLVEHRWSGQQQRSYGPHIWDATLTFTTAAPWHHGGEPRPLDLPEDSVKKYVRLMVCDYQDEPLTDWAAARLDSLIKTAPGVWEVRCSAVYTD